MDVVAYLPPPLMSHLRVVLGEEHQLTPVAGWEELEATVRRRPADIAVVDPTQPGTLRVAETALLRQRYPSVRVVVYTQLSPSAMRVVVELARNGLEHVVLHRFDDDPRRFGELLSQLPGHTLGEMLLHRLRESLERTPPRVAGAIGRMIRTPRQYSAVDDLAAGAGMTRRQLYRVLEAAGFTSPRLLVQAARVVRAFAYLRDPGRLLEDVSAKLGYSEPRVLNRVMLELAGMRPLEARGAIDSEEFVERVATRLFAPALELDDM
ncbi:MAG: helix-turn-helix domain-containing protein [Gemmatimonadaceae bacterium]|nr:helix-turn-helix domain-containing protein [Gemmatimonadaceae bacterium]